MGEHKFDPFRDRLSRDIRNDLSEALMTSIEGNDIKPVEDVASHFLSRDPAPIYIGYIKNRLDLYKQALKIIEFQHINDAFTRGLVLWDLELFFEVHEILEHAWLKATGPEKLILQAMIRAAGVYIHLEYGNRKGARKMAAKAIAGFQANLQSVPTELDIEILLRKLHILDPVPPKLLSL